MSTPAANPAFVGWVVGGSITQIIFTFLLMWLFSLSNFTVGTALSKTEVVQVVLLEALLLQESISGRALIAILHRLYRDYDYDARKIPGFFF